MSNPKTYHQLLLLCLDDGCPDRVIEPIYSAPDHEKTIDEPTIIVDNTLLSETNPSGSTVGFTIVEDSSKRGKPKLIDDRGYTYNVKRRKLDSTDWQITVRPKVQ